MSACSCRVVWSQSYYLHKAHCVLSRKDNDVSVCHLTTCSTQSNSNKTTDGANRVSTQVTCGPECGCLALATTKFLCVWDRFCRNSENDRWANVDEVFCLFCEVNRTLLPACNWNLHGLSLTQMCEHRLLVAEINQKWTKYPGLFYSQVSHKFVPCKFKTQLGSFNTPVRTSVCVCVFVCVFMLSAPCANNGLPVCMGPGANLFCPPSPTPTPVHSKNEYVWLQTVR